MTTIDTAIADKALALWCGDKDAAIERPTSAEKEMLCAIACVARVLTETGSLAPLVSYCDDMYPELAGDELKADLVELCQRAGVSSDGTKAELITRLEAL